MTKDRRQFSNAVDWEKADEELREARRLYDEGRITFQQFGMTSILDSLADKVLAQYTIGWRLSKRPNINTRHEDKCRYRVKFRRRSGNKTQDKTMPLNHIYVESSDADSINIVSKTEERLLTKGLTPDSILETLVAHVRSY